MKSAIIVAVSALICGCAGVKSKTEYAQNMKLYPPNNGPLCFLPGSAPEDARYEILGRVLATKGTYGTSEQLYPALTREARKLGADAVINFNIGQSFKGPLPWRITSPTGYGTAIKLLPDSPRINCALFGGQAF